MMWRFQDPILGLIVLATGITILVLAWVINGQRPIVYSTSAWQPFVRPTWRVRLRPVLWLLKLGVVIALALAMARPQSGLEQSSINSEGVAIQLVVDRSSSMLSRMSTDGQSNASRLAVVKDVLDAFLLGREDQNVGGRSGDLIGLIAFAGFADIAAPLVTDIDGLAALVKSVQPAQSFEDGTSIGDALYVATLNLIGAEDLVKKTLPEDQQDQFELVSRVIVLLTDGQDGGSRPIQDVAELASQHDIKIYTILINSDMGVSRSIFGTNLIPTMELDGGELKQAAEISGGKYFEASDQNALAEVYAEIDALETVETSETYFQYREESMPWLWLALILLALDRILAATVFGRLPADAA